MTLSLVTVWMLGPGNRKVDGLFVIGPLRRGALLESTAMPEIREQAAHLAALLLDQTRQAAQ